MCVYMYIPIDSWPLDKNFCETYMLLGREFLVLLYALVLSQVAECPQRRQVIINDDGKFLLSSNGMY